MKFINWTLDALIRHLTLLKSSELFDYHCTPMCFGEIQFFNGERKDGLLYADIDEIIGASGTKEGE